MAKVLIIEDDADLGSVLEYNLRAAGHEAALADTGSQGIRLAREFEPDVVLLDLMLPDIPGTDVCHVLKSNDLTADIPIIMVTARGEEIDRITGFEVGAEDYVVKPFSIRELVLRIGAVMRRGGPTSPRTDEPVVFGALRFDDAAHRIFLDGAELDLTLVEYKLLLTLFQRRERVQTRAHLLDTVWGITADVTTRTVDTHIKRLREKLGDARDYVETVRGVGYRFVGSPPESRAAAVA